MATLRSRIEALERIENPPAPNNPVAGLAHFLRLAYACRNAGLPLPDDVYVPPAFVEVAHALRDRRARRIASELC